jgi:hypothetical protein
MNLPRVLRPLDYLRIEHPAKRKYDLYFPLFLTIFCLSVYYLLPQKILIFSKDGLIGSISGILQILTGFYIASLAAVATFNKEGMDKAMPGPPLTIKTNLRGISKTDRLTRRRFLCLMFGYLSLISLVLYFYGEASVLIVKSAKILIPAKLHGVAIYSFLATYIFLFANLLVTTLLSLFYMVDRIHREDPALIKAAPGEKNDKGH